MRTHVLTFLLFALASTAAFAQIAPEGLPSDARIKMINYDENDVYTITTKYGYQTNIVFGNGESIDTISVGDRSLWQIIPSGNRLFIRPMQQGISTNMTILSSKRSYQFDLKSLGADDKDSAIYVAKFVYGNNHGYARPPLPPVPPAPPSSETSPPPPPVAEAPPAPPPPLTPKPSQAVYTNYNYTYSGPDTLAPLQVFDNGTTTFIKYTTLPSPLPNIYTVDTAGKRTLVVPETQNTMLAVHTIAGKIELEHTGGTIIVYNEMLNSGN
jgi:type IV secretion system protein VirB9